MKKYSDYIFEKQLEEWINTPDNMLSEGLFDWFKKLKKKFNAWISKMKYDKDTNWDITDKNKSINLDNGKSLYNSFSSNKMLQEKFPMSYKLFADSTIQKCKITICLNSDKAPISIIISSNKPEIFENVLKRSKANDFIESIMKSYKHENDNGTGSWLVIFSIEIANNKKDDKTMNIIKEQINGICQTDKIDRVWFYLNGDTKSTIYKFFEYMGRPEKESKVKLTGIGTENDHTLKQYK